MLLLGFVVVFCFSDLVASAVIPSSFAVRNSSRNLDGCSQNPSSPFENLNTNYCTFSTVYDCSNNSPSGINGRVTSLTCMDATISHINAAAQSFLDAGGNDKISVNLMWAIFQTGMESYNVVIDENVFPKGFFQLIQSVYISIDAPRATLQPSFFQHTPDLLALQLEMLHSVSEGNAKFLRTFTGYFNLPKLEFLLINIAEEKFTINKGLTVNLPALKCLKLVGFRFTCDCGLQDFISALKTKKPSSPIQGEYYNALVDPFFSYSCDIESAFCDQVDNSVPGLENEGASPVSGSSIGSIHLPNCDSSISPPEFSYDVELSLTCEKDKFVARVEDLSVSGNFRLTEFYGYPENGNGECGLQSDGTLQARPGNCGVTSRTAYGKTILEGVVTIVLEGDNAGHLAGHALVEPAREVAYKVKCSEGDLATRTRAVMMGMNKGQASVSTAIAAKSGASVQLYIPETHFAVGRYTFQLHGVNLDSNNYDISVKSCWTTHANSSTETERYDLIRNGCSVDPTLEMEGPIADGNLLIYRYSVAPFKFRGKDNGNVFVHCQAAVCDLRSSDVASCMNQDIDPACGNIWTEKTAAHRRIMTKSAANYVPKALLNKKILGNKNLTGNSGVMAGHLLIH